MKKKSEFVSKFISRLKWIFFVSRRFSRVDRKGRSAVTTFLASAGICFGVMTLIVVISVMNGFQLSFIDSIMEVSSYHIQAKNLSPKTAEEIEGFCGKNDAVRCVFPFYEAQSLVTGKYSSQAAAVIRALPENIIEIDEGFSEEAKIYSGTFDISGENFIVLGTELARRLGVRPGDSVNLLALSGSTEIDLLSADRIFTVTGTVRTGYSDINASYAFISTKSAEANFGENAPLFLGIKLYDTEADGRTISALTENFPDTEFESWRSYNRSFFSTLRIEKNMLMLLVFIIFVVVAINIFNGMRRMVFERREEISVLSAFGGKPSHIQSIFIMQGFLIGIKGAVPGIMIGLLLSVKMPSVFSLMSKIVYYGQLFMFMLLSPENVPYFRENPMYRVYANIPPRILSSEVLAITVFGIFAALLASWFASKSVLKLSVSEIMRDE